MSERRKTYHRKLDTPFELTELERQVLQLVRSGLTHKKIKEAIGHTGKGSSGTLVAQAVEKERLLLLRPKEEGLKINSGFSSLSKAHGETRMKGTK